MVKTRRGFSGWYLVDEKTDRNDKRIRDEKKDASARRISMVKRSDQKRALRRSQAEQREAILEEKLSRARAAVEAKKEEIELAHKLAAELSRRRNEEVKRTLKSARIKSSARSPSSCALTEARSRLTEEKVHLEANQAELLRLWNEDKTFEKLQQAEGEKKKRSLRNDLQNQLADNQRRVQQRRTEEKDEDRKMIERAIRKIQEEDAKVRKKKEDDVILLRAEMARSLAAKKAWERKYKEALKNEDERIARIIAEKEARQEKELSMKTEFRIAKEAAIDIAAKKLLANVCKERKKQEIADELYREEQKSKYIKESIREEFASRKKCAESFQEIMKQKAEREARDKATDVAFGRYLAEEQKKYVEKQKEDNNARHARKIQYGKELKEVIMNNRVTYGMDILERQSEISAHDKNSNQLAATSVKQSERNDNKVAKKECKSN